MPVTVSQLRVPPVTALPVEIVERKGRGHPDSICDALAEEFSLALSRFYVDRFDAVLHHNVDKALLAGGAARPAFGGGKVLAPMDFYLAGRATHAFRGVTIPVNDLCVETCRDWLRRNFRALDPERHVSVHPLVRAGSVDLVELFQRAQREGALANDTSVGVGFAPRTDLEDLVLHVEARLNSSELKTAHPAIGEDIKVLGIRRKDVVYLTVACAFLDRHVTGKDDYAEQKETACRLATEAAEAVTPMKVSVQMNTADDISAGDVYLTVTGTSAEAGDDGQAGRGNRVNGLITPYRPMTLESTAGKNPVTHVGKLYQLAAFWIAEALVTTVGGVSAAECYLASAIGQPITEPQQVDVKLETGTVPVQDFRPEVERVVERELERLRTYWRRAVGRS